jgi:predicted metal-dependent hydrolase
MAEQRYTIRDKAGNHIRVNLRRDKRLRKTSRWERLPDGSLLLRIPYRLPRYRIGPLLGQISDQLDKITAIHAQRNDEDLQKRAEFINQKYFNGTIRWNAIRWVTNMRSRLGSCTGGGSTDGEIRISDKIKLWPDWVVDYVIAHELMHRRHPNHSAAYWKELHAAYPLAERARGFIEGAGFATDHPIEEDAES